LFFLPQSTLRLYAKNAKSIIFLDSFAIFATTLRPLRLMDFILGKQLLNQNFLCFTQLSQNLYKFELSPNQQGCSFSIITKQFLFRCFIKLHKSEYNIFIAVGGDGTVNSLASELIGTDKILGVLPVGSGNGFARELGFRKNIRALVRDIRKKESVSIDVLYLNDTPSINVSGIGIDSLVAHEFNRLTHRGIFSYGISALKVVSRIKPFKVTILADGNKTEDVYYMVSVANTRQFGNNAILAPMARPDDGKFNLVLLKPYPKILLPILVLQMLNGTLKESRYLKYIESENQVIIYSEENRVHVDGEPLVFDNTINVSLKKKALRVLKSSFNTRII
jgi:diacylglycerol kinase (ATP)